MLADGETEDLGWGLEAETVAVKRQHIIVLPGRIVRVLH